mmetsp:Transcript_19457/g.29157  ORF Transcript_19457/g.29157 Transcript_19457/m.29157 type:complete len:594 (-) Transcript_19457:2-1783(-)
MQRLNRTETPSSSAALSTSTSTSTSTKLKQCVRRNTTSSFLLINVTLFLWGSSTTCTSSNGGGSTSNIMIDAFMQPHPIRHCTPISIHGRLSSSTSTSASRDSHWPTTKLYSTTSNNENKIHLSGESNGDDSDSDIDDYNNYLSNHPDIRSFNDALQEIASKYSDTRRVQFDVISRAAAAEALVKKLESDPDAPYRPNINTYNIILKIWSKSAHSLAEGHGRGDINEVFHALDDVSVPDDLMEVVNHISSAKDAADHCSTILTSLEQRYLRGDTLVEPNAHTYNTVMDGWSKSRAKDASQHVQDLFLRMSQWSSEGVTTTGDDDTGSLVHTDATYWEQIKPNKISYSLAIQSYRRRTFSNKMGDIESLVNTLEQEYEDSQHDSTLKPDIGVANAMIKTYMRNADYSSGGGGKFQQSMTGTSWKTAKKVNDIYIQWNKKFKNTGDIDFKPNVITTTMVIDAFGRCGDINATEKAQGIFQSMIKDWQETGDDRLKPSSKTFTAIITAWAKTKDPRSPHKAEELLSLMEEMYAEDVKEGRPTQLLPHSQTYTAAITAWSRSLDNTKPQRALRILKKVIDLHKNMNDKRIKPTLISF